MQSTPPDDSAQSLANQLAQAGRALETALSRAERLRNQRDEARVQRDFARAQRDDARQQRDNLQLTLDAAADGRTLTPSIVEFPSAPEGVDPGRRLRRRKRPPTGFAALPRSDVASSPYSLMRYEEREQARQLVERRLQPLIAAGRALSLAEREIGAARQMPQMRRLVSPLQTPASDVAFATVADINFYPGLMGLVLSLIETYPDFASTVFVFHDGSIGRFAQERLIDIYPNIEFIAPEMDWLDIRHVDFADAKRVGKLGFMKFMALTLSGFSRVIILDADLMVLDDISALWTGSASDARAAFDLGNREYAIRSDYTGQWIINSGVISLPGSWCTPVQFELAKQTIRRTIVPLDDLLDQFADQKSWNVFLAERKTSYLEVNFNCNVKYVGRFLGGKLEAISILHFAGPKPWNNGDYLPEALVSRTRSMACVFPNLWIDRYRAMLFKRRSLSYQRDKAQRATREVAAGPLQSRTCILTDDWTDRRGAEHAASSEADVVHVVHGGLPDFFESLAPRHIVFANHDFLGGWNSLNPAIPADCAQRIAALPVPPKVWAPYYFKPIFEVFARKHGLEIAYLLHEVPFVRQVVDVGTVDCRADGFLDGCGDDTLTFGAPVAYLGGYDRVLTSRDTGAANAPDGSICGLSAGVSLLAESLRRDGIELIVGLNALPRMAAPANSPRALEQAPGE